MKLFYTLLLFSFHHFCLPAQNVSKSEIAAKHIMDLKTGALVIRLDFRSKAINTYQQYGQTLVAHQISEEQNSFNTEFYKAVMTNYRFSKFYFIKAEDYDTIFNKAAEGMFLNAELQYDTSIHCTAVPVFFFLIMA